MRAAKRALERPGLAVRIANVIGSPIEGTIGHLPKRWQEGIVGISRHALERAARVAIWTIDPIAPPAPRDGFHKVVVSAAVSEAAEYLARGGAKVAEPALVRFITAVAARFQIQVRRRPPRRRCRSSAPRAAPSSTTSS